MLEKVEKSAGPAEGLRKRLEKDQRQVEQYCRMGLVFWIGVTRFDDLMPRD